MNWPSLKCLVKFLVLYSESFSSGQIKSSGSKQKSVSKNISSYPVVKFSKDVCHICIWAEVLVNLNSSFVDCILKKLTLERIKVSSCFSKLKQTKGNFFESK